MHTHPALPRPAKWRDNDGVMRHIRSLGGAHELKEREGRQTVAVLVRVTPYAEGPGPGVHIFDIFRGRGLEILVESLG